MPVPLTGLGDTFGVWAPWGLQHIEEFCGSSDWLQEKFGVLQIAPVEEGEAACPWQAGCLCPPVQSCAFLVVFAHWTVVERQRAERGVALSLATLPFSANAGLLPAWVINSCGSSSKSLPWALLNLGFLKLHGFLVCLLIPCILLDAFTLFPISFSILLLSKQIKVKFLL